MPQCGREPRALLKKGMWSFPIYRCLLQCIDLVLLIQGSLICIHEHTNDFGDLTDRNTDRRTPHIVMGVS